MDRQAFFCPILIVCMSYRLLRLTPYSPNSFSRSQSNLYFVFPGVPDVPKIVKVESKEVGVAVITLQPIQTKLGPTPGSFKVKAQPESLLRSKTYDIPFPLPTYGDHTKVECRIEGLSVGEIYTFTASVSNTFGESDFCSPMYFTVPGKEDLERVFCLHAG